MSIIKGKTNIVAGFGGTKRPLGEVYFSQSSLASDNPGALPGWTGEYYENGKTLFPDLYNFVKAHSELQVTKAEYDSAITSYGECPKYVVDENTAQTSLRLPKYANYIKMANSTDGITQKGAGLPNVTGYLASIDTNGRWGLIANASADDYNTHSGAFRAQNDGGYTQSVSTGKVVASGDLFFDASKSNAIYGASDTVQPAHTTLYPWISAYTSAVPASTADFTGELNKKVSKSGDTMTGNLLMGTNQVRFGTADNYYYVRLGDNFDIGKNDINNLFQGLMLNTSDNLAPYYTVSGTAHRLLTTADLADIQKVLDTIPTKTSELTNDSGYIKSVSHASSTTYGTVKVVYDSSTKTLNIIN